MELDYVGQSVLGRLPRWLGEGGEVLLGTVTPPGTSSSSGVVRSGSSGEVNPATIPGGVFTIIVSSSLPRLGDGGKYCNSTCREEKYDAQVRRQALAGWLLGGFMVLFVVGCGVWVVCLWKRKKRRRKHGKDSSGSGGDGYVMQDVGVVGGKTEREETDEQESQRPRVTTLSLDDT